MDHSGQDVYAYTMAGYFKKLRSSQVSPNEFESSGEYFNHIDGIIESLITEGCDLRMTGPLNILMRLPNEYEHIVDDFIAHDKKINLQSLRQRLIEFEARRNIKDQLEPEKQLAMVSRPHACPICSKKHHIYDCWYNPNSKNFDKSKVFKGMGAVALIIIIIDYD
jgi:hypothetical protein